MSDQQAASLRHHAAQVSEAVEARIRGDAAAGERIRRSTQQVQIAGMGPAEYWGTQLWQPLKNVCLIMAQEMGVLPAINGCGGTVTAAEAAKKVGGEELLIGTCAVVIRT